MPIMEHYTLLLLLCGLGITPIQAQIKECEVLNLTDAIVISEYLPCPQLDSFYIEGNHYIHFDGRTVPFKTNASFNKYLIDHFETRVNIPDSLYTFQEDPILDYLLYDYTYNLYYSKHERRNHEKKGRIDSHDIYKRKGKQRLYIAYSFSGEIVMYKMRSKIILHQGFNDPVYEKKPIKSSNFAVLKKVELGGLRSLTIEEANSMKLEKDEKSCIFVFAPE